MLYKDIGDYLSQKQKLKIVAESDLDTIDWQEIIPNDEGDWVNQRDPRFAKFRAISDRKTGKGIFSVSSALNKSDAWVYNQDKTKLQGNVERMIGFYNYQVEEFHSYCKKNSAQKPKDHVDDFIDTNPTKISWSRSLKSLLLRTETS